jgi:hypothetical protein
MSIAYSINNVPIRLTHERWFHIVENHDGYLNVIYRELSTTDGFIITAFFTSKINRSQIRWKKT